MQSIETIHTGTTAAAVLGLLFALGIGLGLYIFFCYCCKRICEKTGHTPGVLIWIPIVNMLPLLEAAGMAAWMILLMLIPFVNLVIVVMMWAKICQARRKSPWLVLLLLIPLVNVVFIPYLAFSE